MRQRERKKRQAQEIMGGENEGWRDQRGTCMHWEDFSFTK